MSKSKNVLVFGSSAGIGKSIAVEFLKEGANVCIASRNSEKLKRTHSELQSMFPKSTVISSRCDISIEDEVNETIAYFHNKLGEVDILVNNQAGPKPGGFEGISDEDLLFAFNQNLLSFYRTCKLCVPDMKKNSWGRIINILSISAKESIPNMMISNILRPGLLGFSKTLAQELASSGVTVNSILPNAVMTDRSKDFINLKATEENLTFDQAHLSISGTLPIKRLANPDEVARACIFLCSNGASYISGVALPIDAASSKSIF